MSFHPFIIGGEELLASGSDEKLSIEEFDRLHKLFAAGFSLWLAEVERQLGTRTCSGLRTYELRLGKAPVIEVRDGNHIRRFYARRDIKNDQIDWVLTDPVREMADAEIALVFGDDHACLIGEERALTPDCGFPEKAVVALSTFAPAQIREQWVGDKFDHISQMRDLGWSDIWISLLVGSGMVVQVVRANITRIIPIAIKLFKLLN